jgi:hypothetical protein
MSLCGLKMLQVTGFRCGADWGYGGRYLLRKRRQEWDDAAENASSANFWNIFGDVTTVDHVIAKLNPAASGGAP